MTTHDLDRREPTQVLSTIVDRLTLENKELRRLLDVYKDPWKVIAALESRIDALEEKVNPTP